MSLTVPQMIMLNHAAWVNRERAEKKFKKDRRKEQQPSYAEEEEDDDEPDVPTWNGVPITELNSKQLAMYYGGFFQGS